jgi:F-box-like
MPSYSLPTPLERSRRQELSAKVKQLQGTRAGVCRMKAQLEQLEQRRNLPLPPELMGMIFDFYVHHYGQLPEKLLLVCRAWHVLALSQPMLWTNLDPLGQFGLSIVQPWAGTFLQSRIARSNPAPLKVDFTGFSWDMTSSVVKKVAAVPTFRPRIQELVVSRAVDASYLVGPQPLLKSLTIKSSYPHPLKEIIVSPRKFRLAEKTLTTLCLHSPPKPSVWPDSLLRQVHTLEVVLVGGPEALHEYWTIIQRSTTLRSLHITLNCGSAPPLSHSSVQRLSIVCPQFWGTHQIYSLEEVRMPCLQHILIDTSYPKLLTQLKLVETPVLSLRLICRPHASSGDVDPAVDFSWVDGVVRLLRSTFRLKRLEISAPPGLVSGLLEAFEEDGNLCANLNAFIIGGMTITGIREDDKFDQLRSKVAAFMDKRQYNMPAHEYF